MPKVAINYSMKDDPPILVAFTGNKNKIKEITRIIGHENFLSVDIDVEEIQAVSVEKVASRKIIDSYNDLMKTPLVLKNLDGKVVNENPLRGRRVICFVEDTGLGFKNEGEYKNEWYPGALIKFYYRSKGNETIASTNLGSPAKITTCIGVLYEGLKEPIVFCAKLEANVVKPRGEHGFDFDFILELPSGKTFAELTPEEKDQHSPRGNAIRELANHLKEQGIDVADLSDESRYGDRHLVLR